MRKFVSKRSNSQTLTLSVASSVFLIFFAVILCAGVYVACAFFLPLAKKDVAIVVNNGDGRIKICNQIKKSASFRYSSFLCFHWRLLSLFRSKVIAPGNYWIEKGSSASSVVNRLSTVLMHKISFPEGMSVYEVADALNKDPLTTGHVDHSLLREGYLMPDTYVVANNASKMDVIAMMQKSMTNFIHQEWEKRDPDIPLKSYKEALILASIVEQEAALEEEKGLIASVYINRLRANMRLQSCPTIIYALTNKMGRSFFRNGNGDKQEARKLITFKDLFIDSEYNTYRRAGLPPTPICNPGRSSFLAVLHPEKTNYLFFINKGERGHIFSEKFSDHVSNRKCNSERS